MKTRSNDQSGFTLIECTFALLITMIGVLGAAGLLAVGIRKQVEARDTTSASSFAKAKIEQLQNTSPASALRARGGQLNADVVGYNDSPDPRYRRRWKIETYPLDAGVPANTQRITVQIVPATPGVRLPNVQVTALMAD